MVKKRFVPTTGDVKLAKKLFEEHHLPVVEIASQIGISYNSMNMFIVRLRKQGVITENRNNRETIHRRKRAIEMLQKGYEKTYIAEVLGVHHATICKYAKSIGIVRKKGKSPYIKSLSKIHPMKIKNNALYEK